MIFKKSASVALFFFATISSAAQVHDNFNDGEFDISPQWHGDIDLFVIEEGILRTAGNTETDEIFLSTSLLEEDVQQWQLHLKLDFAPSGSNKFRFYLKADSLDLLNATKAIYLEVGQTGDDVFKLIKKSGGQIEELVVSKKVFASNVEENIRVAFVDNEWSLFFMDERGDYIRDTSVVSGFPVLENFGYTGFACFHTSTRRDKFILTTFMQELL